MPSDWILMSRFSGIMVEINKLYVDIVQFVCRF